jgi:hypothetical protein
MRQPLPSERGPAGCQGRCFFSRWHPGDSGGRCNSISWPPPSLSIRSWYACDRLLRCIKFALCILFLFATCFVCYRHPVQDDFDRYIYEAIVRGKSQPLEAVYSLVKHENPRTEESSVLDNPEHLRELEPLYAVRPLYLKAISAVSAILPIQNAITFISAASLFGIGIVTLFWTKKPLLSALLIASYPIVTLGRVGTPDALAALLAILGLWLLDRETHPVFGLSVLFLSLGVRTDNILLLLAVLLWLVWKKEVAAYVAVVLAALAVAVVLEINRWAGNYGWIVLFRFSFIGGRYPAQLPHTLTLREYLSALVRGVSVVFSHVSIWMLMGILAWLRRPTNLLVLTGLTALAHFLLFPSPEDRYLIWAYIVTGIILLRSFEGVHSRAGHGAGTS